MTCKSSKGGAIIYPTRPPIREAPTPTPYITEDAVLGRTTQEKDLGVTFSADMKVSQQCGIDASKGNQILGLIMRTIIYREKQQTVPLCKAMVITH